MTTTQKTQRDAVDSAMRIVQFMLLALACCFMFLAFSFSAEAQTVGIHLNSAHHPGKAGDNNVNRGIYVRTEGGLVAGTYLNTIRRQSFYAGYSIDVGAFSATLGAVSGYQKRDGSGHTRGAISPLFALSARGPELFGIAPRLTYAPGRFVGGSDVLHLSVERAL